MQKLNALYSRLHRAFFKGESHHRPLHLISVFAKRGFWRLSSLSLLILIILVLFSNVHASTDYFVWDQNLAINLPAYNNYVEFNQTTYFSDFTWDDSNATTITFSNLGTGTTNTLGTISVCLNSGNLSFYAISSDEVDFNLTGATNSNYTLTSKPTKVYLNTIESLEGAGNWTWNSLTNTLTLTVTVPVVVNFVWLMSANTAFVVGAFALIIALTCFGMLVFVRRRRH